MAWTLTTVVYVVGLLACGSLNTITMKIAFTMKGETLAGEEQTFQKPWFITFIMFVAMALALLFDRTIWGRLPSGKNAPLIDGSPSGADGGERTPFVPWGKKVQMVAYPAIFDIVATGLCCMGFLYIPASVWQLLRGAEMVFAALFAVIFLQRKLYAFHWLGIVLASTGIVLVGLASVWGEASAKQNSGASEASVQSGQGLLILGMSFALGGQVVQAAQVIAEEWLLKDVDLPGVTIVGFEGVWGGLMMVIVGFPLLYLIPGSDNGHVEDEADSFAMLESNPQLLLLVLVYTFSCSTYNMSGIAVTGALSAVHRVMLEAMRTSIVWVFGLCVHYFYDPRSAFGEAWTPFSWLEVAGFVVLIFGQAVYGTMLKVPGLYYPREAAEPAPSPGAGGMRNLASPLPRDQ